MDTQTQIFILVSLWAEKIWRSSTVYDENSVDAHNV